MRVCGFATRTSSWYVGASGALHGVMAAGALAHVRRRDRDGWMLAGVPLSPSLATSSWAGAMPFSAGLGPVIVNAHLYGALGGLGASALLTLRRGWL